MMKGCELMNIRQEKEELIFFLERLYCAQEIPIHIYDPEGNTVVQTGTDPSMENPFVSDEELYSLLLEKSTKSQHPIIEMEEPIFAYGCFFDDQHNLYVAGPIAVEKLTFEALFSYGKRHNMKNKDYKIPQKSHTNLANVLSLLYYTVTGKMISEDGIMYPHEEQIKRTNITDEEHIKYQFEKAEQETEHVAYQYELEYMKAIEDGDVEFFEKSFSKQPNVMDKIGKLAEENMKQMEYMCVSSIVLVSRAAIAGGISPEKAYALSDLYMRKLEKCKNTQEIIALHYAMRMEYVTLVKESKERYKSEDYIERCKDYITKRVHYPIRISEIADALGVSHAHLSRRFSEREGMTIVQYSIKVKLKAAANMLKYSEASIAEIADYFCFTSQSRFGSQFKSEFGITPDRYRKENRVIGFTTDDEN